MMESESSFELKGIERLFESNAIRIAHVIHISSSNPQELEDLYSRARDAWRWVLSKHPRMRASFEETTVKPTEKKQSFMDLRPTISESAVDASLEIHPYDPDRIPWQDYVWEECHTSRPYRNTSETLFALTLYKPKPKESRSVGTIILFSDHAVSDGFSGYVILKDFLERATNPSLLQEPPTPHPNPTSMMDQLATQTPWMRRYVDRVLSFVISRFMPLIFKSFTPALAPYFTADPNGKETARISTKNFASGTPDHLEAALKKCRLENTTLMGPICIAIALAIASCQADKADDEKSHVRLNVSVDYNLRAKVGMSKDNVGCFIGIANLAQWGSKGLPLQQRFWDLARDCKAQVTNGMSGMSTMFTLFDTYHDRFEGWSQSLQYGVGDDVNISNLGRWPFASSFGSITLDQSYLYHRTVGGVDSGMVFFITSIRTLNYAMTSQLTDASVADRVFQKAVHIIERVGEIGPEMTVNDVLEMARKV